MSVLERRLEALEMASEGFLSLPQWLVGGAICERTSAPPAIALVTKSPGNFPLAGNAAKESPLRGTP
jgi:hypothetical protein